MHIRLPPEKTPTYHLATYLSHPVIVAMSGSNETALATCGFEGDENIYGLGVRLGVYFQWIATAVAYNAVPEQAAQVQTVNLCFQLSVLVALLYATAPSSAGDTHQVKAVEAYIIFILCVGGVFARRGLYAVTARESDLATLKSQPGGRTKQRATPAGLTIILAINGAILACGLWLAYHRLESLRNDGCPNDVFFFAPVDLFGRFRTLLQVILTGGALLILATSLAVLSSVCSLVWQRGPSYLLVNVFAPLRKWNVHDAQAQLQKIGEKEHTWVFGFMIPADLLFFVLTIELTIRWNHITGVDNLASTGQLIPLIVGCTAMLTMAYEVILKRSTHDLSEFPAIAFQLSFVDTNGKTGLTPDFAWFPTITRIVAFIANTGRARSKVRRSDRS
jgi:hypothetical protein